MADFRLSGSYAGGRNLISTDSPGDISILDAKHTTLTLYTRVPETVLQGTLNTVYVPFRVIQYVFPAVITIFYSRRLAWHDLHNVIKFSRRLAA